ncbi:MAG TPA: ethylbenzene dehydrogenase-related protein [Hyphomicrobiaceae bacterium]|nr:ethylbenzene dehydrogenase-related protein [Hyphomicrobiaceae bacterium]
MSQARTPWLLTSLALFLGTLAVSWLTHGKGVVTSDPASHRSVPAALTVPLSVQAAYNGRDIVFRYRWPSPNPGIFHDMLRFEGGKWVVKGSAVPGSQPDGLHEDRVAMMLDDGSVPEFSRYGAYITVGHRLAGLTNDVSGKDVAKHPYLGAKLKQDELTKYLPATRSKIDDWASVVPEDELNALRNAGYFLDLWHWRANRSNPVGLADDQLVAEARLSDAGKGMYVTNWDGEKKQPRLMFDAGKAGHKALKWDDLKVGKITQDVASALREDIAMPFDPGAGWQDGDTLPRRIVRPGDGSRADIKVVGKAAWKDGFWDVTLTRKMDTGNKREDKILVDRGIYHVAFAVHRQATGGRWHYVSLPFSLGLGRAAEITAARFEGDQPKWDQPAKTITLFYPGQVTWGHVNSAAHAGAEKVRAGVPVRHRHSEAELTHYGIEMEYDAEIKRQWLLTMLAGVLLIAAFGIALNRTLGPGKGV